MWLNIRFNVWFQVSFAYKAQWLCWWAPHPFPHLSVPQPHRTPHSPCPGPEQQCFEARQDSLTSPDLLHSLWKWFQTTRHKINEFSSKETQISKQEAPRQGQGAHTMLLRPVCPPAWPQWCQLAGLCGTESFLVPGSSRTGFKSWVTASWLSDLSNLERGASPSLGLLFCPCRAVLRVEVKWG